MMKTYRRAKDRFNRDYHLSSGLAKRRLKEITGLNPHYIAAFITGLLFAVLLIKLVAQ